MPTAPATTADDIAETIRSLIDRVADAKLTQEMARRGQDAASVIAERGAEVGDRATDVWHDTRPMRRNAAKRFARATADAARWSDRTWRKSIRPALKDLWKRRTLAAGAAGAALPAAGEIVDTAAVRLGIREREERHWGAFFLGLLIGAAVGAVVALLTTPKRGSEMRHEIGVRADEIATKAKDAEWVPIFQREDYAPTNGRPSASSDALADASGTVQEAAAEAGEAAEGTAGAAADVVDDAADAIKETSDTVDRESPA